MNDNIWKLDGYAENTNGRKCWEFNGCWYHPGCPFCGDQKLLTTHWLQKIKDLESLGIQVEVMWSCQFKEKLKQLQHMSTPSSLDMILQKNQSETDLLNAILNEKVFGLMVADINCLSGVSRKFHNFPPIVHRRTITEDMLTRFMKEKIRSERGDKAFKQETLIQCYNVKDYLLLSAVAKQYLEWGIQISNIKWFMQYESQSVLRPFADSVTTMRIDAEKMGDSTKSTTAKIFGNSGYGKVNYLSFFVIIVKMNNFRWRRRSNLIRRLYSPTTRQK